MPDTLANFKAILQLVYKVVCFAKAVLEAVLANDQAIAHVAKAMTAADGGDEKEA